MKEATMKIQVELVGDELVIVSYKGKDVCITLEDDGCHVLDMVMVDKYTAIGKAIQMLEYFLGD